MTLAARLTWIVVILALVAGAAGVALAVRARSAAAEELAAVTNRSEALEKESREQPGRIASLREQRRDRIELARECLVVIGIESAAMRQLFRDLRTGPPSVGGFAEYSDRARELQLGFRQLIDDC